MRVKDAAVDISQLIQQWVDEHVPLEQRDGTSSSEDPVDSAIASAIVDATQVQRWWAEQLSMSEWDGSVELSSAVELAARIPFEFAMDHLLVLLEARHAGYRCLTARPWRWQALDNLSMHLNAPLQLEIATEMDVRDVVGRVYDQHMSRSGAVANATNVAASATSGATPTVDQALAQLGDRDLLATANKEPVAKLVDALLYEATQKRASDLHVHPYAEHLKVRYRLDGVLHDRYQLSRTLLDQIVGRIKVLAGMDVAEKRLAQDGRTSVQIGTRRIDLRVSTLPTTYGERVVIRLLEQTVKLKELAELGMPRPVEQSFKEGINRSTGLILVTGPTGSGKTTTLYSALAQLDATAKNILTLEDPVEYRLAGISQTQVSDKKGMTFLSGLRHILRQDPDVIMVGEIRDEPTARMVIQSSLTGHLVLSTLHTNSAAGAIARLMDLGIEPFLIASSLIGVLAQRLVRTCCHQCRHERNPGCTTCNGTGYSGRLALFEWLYVSAPIRAAIAEAAPAERIESIARTAAMRTLREQGAKAVQEGITTAAELLRVLGSEDI